MRDLLLKRVRPLVERLAEDLVSLATDRIEAELERLSEMFEIALSAYANDSSEYAGAEFVELDRERDLGAGIAAMERAVDSMLGPVAQRDPKPANVTNAGKERQRAVMRCTKCGALGFRSDGCGKTHQPERVLTAITPTRTLKPTPAALDAAKARIKERISSIARQVAAKTTTNTTKRKPDPDDNENAEERWTPREIAEDIEITESRKHAGELPRPRSSFTVTPRNSGEVGYGADLGDVEELDFT